MRCASAAPSPIGRFSLSGRLLVYEPPIAAAALSNLGSSLTDSCPFAATATLSRVATAVPPYTVGSSRTPFAAFLPVAGSIRPNRAQFAICSERMAAVSQGIEHRLRRRWFCAEHEVMPGRLLPRWREVLLPARADFLPSPTTAARIRAFEQHSAARSQPRSIGLQPDGVRLITTTHLLKPVFAPAVSRARPRSANSSTLRAFRRPRANVP